MFNTGLLGPYKWRDGAPRVYQGRTLNYGAGVLARFRPTAAVEFGISAPQRLRMSPIVVPLPKDLAAALNVVDTQYWWLHDYGDERVVKSRLCHFG